MKMHVYEDERWPTLVVEKVKPQMENMKYFQSSIVEVSDELFVRIEAANIELNAVEAILYELLEEKRK